MPSTYIRISTHTPELWDRIAHSYIPGKGEVCIIEPTDETKKTSIKVGDGDKIFSDLEFLTTKVQSDWKATNESDPSFIYNKPTLDTDLLDDAVSGLIFIDWEQLLYAKRTWNRFIHGELTDVEARNSIISFGPLANYVQVSSLSAASEEFIYNFADSTLPILPPGPPPSGKEYTHGACIQVNDYLSDVPVEEEATQWVDHVLPITPFYGTLDGTPDGIIHEIPEEGIFNLNNDLLCWIDHGIYANVNYIEQIANSSPHNKNSLEGHRMAEFTNVYYEEKMGYILYLPTLIIPYRRQQIKRRYIDLYTPDWDVNNPSAPGYIKNRPMYRSSQNRHDIIVDPEYLEALQRGTLFLISIDENGQADKTYKQIEDAYNSGKAIWAVDGERIYQLVQFDEDGNEDSRQTEEPYTFENFLEDETQKAFNTLTENEINSYYERYKQEILGEGTKV